MLLTDLWSAFDRVVQRYGAKPAILKGDERWTFAEWRTGALAWGSIFRSTGVEKGSRVLIAAEPSAQTAAAILGAWSLGAIVVLFDSEDSGGHLEHAVRLTSPVAMVGDEDGLEAPGGSGLPRLSLGQVPSAPSAYEVFESLPTDPASIVFTSGSTGPPKGVVQSHGNLTRAAIAVAGYLDLATDDRICCPIPWSFDYGYGQFLSSVVLGATHILPVLRNPFGVCEAIGRHKPTLLAGLPSLFTYLLRGVSPFRETDTSSIRTVTNSGGTVPGPILDELVEMFVGARVFLNYGLTETYRTSYLDPGLIRSHSTSIGKPIPGVGVVIVKEDGSVAGAGEEGEIVHRGDYICHGYWENPVDTARVLRPDPCALPGHPNPPQVLHTGDYGYMDDDGYLYFLGRRDRLLKSMGVRVSPEEVEDLLHRSGLLREVAVFGRKHDLIGDEIWAAIVPAESSGDVESRAAEYCKGTMSRYMLPRRYLVLDELPKTPSGKTDYQTLEEAAEQEVSSSFT